MSNGSFEFYNAGRFQGDAADLFMFTCWNESHTSCGCFSVYEGRLNSNIRALEQSGSVNRTARRERFDYAKREWVSGQ